MIQFRHTPHLALLQIQTEVVVGQYMWQYNNPFQRLEHLVEFLEINENIVIIFYILYKVKWLAVS